uniref:Uncharacterized protein n=1 Tax=Glossina pallidipes TaxID=7398 RepID=A0A1A9ZAJ2_GLOPL
MATCNAHIPTKCIASPSNNQQQVSSVCHKYPLEHMHTRFKCLPMVDWSVDSLLGRLLGYREGLSHKYCVQSGVNANTCETSLAYTLLRRISGDTSLISVINALYLIWYLIVKTAFRHTIRETLTEII